MSYTRSLYFQEMQKIDQINILEEDSTYKEEYRNYILPFDPEGDIISHFDFSEEAEDILDILKDYNIKGESYE